jgi:hypothetical protein
MKKKRSKKPNNRPKKLNPTNAASPWRKYKNVAPKLTTPAPVIADREDEIPLGGNPDEIAEEVESLEAQEPDELTEGEE